MSRLFKLRRNEKGQGIVEFALVAPILIMLILGMIEFGWLLNGKITINSAAREGARVGAVIISNSDFQTRIEAAVRETSNLSGLTIKEVSWTKEDEFAENKHNIVVEVKAEMTPIIGLYVQDNVEMTSSAKMRKE